ncbi:RluA family pseudouridine synthase [Yunchengibacter salinarum]|uniref:RluA family pseudouridine synthase n=1 Tax=Yunchengibacter salinarum TaxID=3133399 RepID=UPI0035B64DA1
MAEAPEFVISSAQAGTRLDKLLATNLPHMSRSRLSGLIKAGHVSLVRAGTRSQPTSGSLRLKTGDVVCCAPPEALATGGAPAPEAMPLTVVHEDEHLIVVDKPAGLVVHPGAGNHIGTLVAGVLAHTGGRLSRKGDVERPGVVHRIDKDTSGLLVLAKSDAAHDGLSALFKTHHLTRRYLALVHGLPHPADDWIDAPIARHPTRRTRMAVVGEGGRRARTHYALTAAYGAEGITAASLLTCTLETGRTHQVRVHMAERGHPLLGDSLYGGQRKPSGRLPAPLRAALGSAPRQMLHAATLAFTHPCTGAPLHFESAPPSDIQRLLSGLAPYKQSE